MDCPSSMDTVGDIDALLQVSKHYHLMLIIFLWICITSLIKVQNAKENFGNSNWGERAENIKALSNLLVVS